MKTFKRFIKENTVIKLGSRLTHPGVAGFMDELGKTSHQHPFNHNEKLIGNASVHVSPHGDGIHLHDIHSFEPKSGAGTAALKHLTSLADKHGVSISGVAKAYMDNRSGKIADSSQLKSWYGKHGFSSNGGNRRDGYDISYEPKSS